MDFSLHGFNKSAPSILEQVITKSEAIGFDMSASNETGELLSFLAALKPGGRFLEIGTGTGVGASWILNGMDQTSHLTSIEIDQKAHEIAVDCMGNDPRVTFLLEDGLDFLKQQKQESFDFIFADTYPGKYEYVSETLDLLKPKGIYIVDDMKPQSDWPEDWFPIAHKGLEGLQKIIEESNGFHSIGMNYATGLISFVKL